MLADVLLMNGRVQVVPRAPAGDAPPGKARGGGCSRGDPPGPGAQPVLRPGRMRIEEQALGSADLAAFNAAAVPQRLNPQRQRLLRVESEGLLEAVVALEAEQGGPGSVARQELRHSVAAHHFILALRVDVAAAVPAVITLAQ